MQPILIAIDFTVCDVAVLDFAALHAARLGAPAHVVHVAAPEPEFVGLDPGPPSVRDGTAAELREEHRRVEDVVQALRARSIVADGRLLRGVTVDSIVAEADRVDASLIVVGRRARGTIASAVLGSTSTGLIHTARRPVLVVPTVQDC